MSKLNDKIINTINKWKAFENLELELKNELESLNEDHINALVNKINFI